MATPVSESITVVTYATVRAGASLMPSPTIMACRPLVLDILDRFGVILGKDLRTDIVRGDSDLLGDCASNSLVVASDHHHVGGPLL